MISEEQYQQAIQQRDDAQKVINLYFREKHQAFEEKIASNYHWTDEDLIYSAQQLCPCGHGLAYPKGCNANHYWDCSGILKGIADPAVEHTGKLPFMFYDIKSESEHHGTTRGVFLPKQA